MSRSTTILRNVASNWVGFAVSAGITLALTPFVLRQLGTAQYGIWILTSSIIGYYGFLDVGFRAGVTQYLTRYLAVGDDRRASDCLSSAVAVLSLLGVGMFGLSLVAANLAPRIFDLPDNLERDAFWCILIVGSSSAIQFSLSSYTSVFTARQRFDLANAIGLGTRLLTAGGIVLALKMDAGLIGVSAATCAASAVDYVVRWRVARRLVPQLSVSWRRASVQRIREIGSFGAWNFLISLNAFVYQHVPNLLIGSMMPIAAVGHYALATGLTRQINSVLTPVPQVLYPAAAELHVRGDRQGLERLYHDGSRLMLLVLLAVVLPAFFWSKDFYRLWIGERYLSGVPFQSVALLFQILLLSVTTSYSSSIAGQVLVGAGHVRKLAIVLIAGSVLNLGSSFLLIGRFGLAGVAAATAMASVIVDLFAVPLLLQRTVGFSFAGFARRACLRPLAAGVVQMLAIVAIRTVASPDTWFDLAWQGVAAGVAIIAAIVIVGLTNEERQRYLGRPFARLVSRHRQAIEVVESQGVR